MKIPTLHTAKFHYLGIKGKSNILELRQHYTKVFESFINALNNLSDADKIDAIDLSIMEEIQRRNAIKDNEQIYDLHEANIKKLNDLKTSSESDKQKHTYPTLSKKYDATKVYNSFFKGEIGLCTIDCFNDWFVNGYKSEKIKPTLQGRQGKIAVAQIRSFIETITENSTDLKDGYYNNVFGLMLNNTKTAKNLSLEHEAKLKLCKK